MCLTAGFFFSGRGDFYLNDWFHSVLIIEESPSWSGLHCADLPALQDCLPEHQRWRCQRRFLLPASDQRSLLFGNALWLCLVWTMVRKKNKTEENLRTSPEKSQQRRVSKMFDTSSHWPKDFLVLKTRLHWGFRRNVELWSWNCRWWDTDRCYLLLWFSSYQLFTVATNVLERDQNQIQQTVVKSPSLTLIFHWLCQ